jgi:lipoprotein-anchoring transpeptidase ErfK/SrfK
MWLVTGLLLGTAFPAGAIAQSAMQTERVFDAARNQWVTRKVEKNQILANLYKRSNASPIPRAIVPFEEKLKPGTIVIDTGGKWLYRVMEPGQAERFAIGVGREGFTWSGREKITRKAEWPTWTPPQAMRVREAANGVDLPEMMDGGPDNPLGARALYLGHTEYRIHGTNQPWTIGKAVSSGCIRMANDDVIYLYNEVNIGDTVIVR